jgi:predicted aldo/keto reductase-like oxidoreductase
MTKLGRRNFLKSTLFGTGGAMLSAPLLAGTKRKSNKDDIIARKLGKTGLEMPVLGMGAMLTYNPYLVRASLEAGIRHFDTAHEYMGGRNEEMLGEVFKDVERDNIIISTKVPPGERDRFTGELGSGSSKGDFLGKFEISLKRLQMDHVDILYHHGAYNRAQVLYEPILDALLTAKKEGKTRFIGVSTHSNEPEVIDAVVESGVLDVVLVAYNFNQDHYIDIKVAMNKAAIEGVGFIGMKSMAGGFLDRERQYPIDGKAALKWILQDPNLTACIPGFTTFDHFYNARDVLRDLTLTQEEMDHIELARLEAGLYCNQCEECIPQCPKRLPIPAIMRSYMYTYGYRELEKARELLDDYNVGPDPCHGCPECTVNCKKGFIVADRIADVSRLAEVPRDFIS